MSLEVEYFSLLRSFERELRYEQKKPKTIAEYIASARLFGRWLCDGDEPIESTSAEHRGRLVALGYVPTASADGVERFLPGWTVTRPTDVASINREHVQAWILSLAATDLTDTTQNYRYRSLQQFLNFLVEEDELAVHPMSRLKPPKVREKVVPTVSTDDLKKLLATCKGKGFQQLRDDAILRLYIDSGGRLREVASLTVDDLDMKQDVAHTIGKGGKPRALPFGNRTALSIERYLRARAKHPTAHLPQLWLAAGRAGATGGAKQPPLTPNGVHQMIKRRSAEAGIPRIHAHQFRHTMATDFMDTGGNPNDLMRLMGWESHQMVKRYTNTSADRRAREAHRKTSLGDRL